MNVLAASREISCHASVRSKGIPLGLASRSWIPAFAGMTPQAAGN